MIPLFLYSKYGACNNAQQCCAVNNSDLEDADEGIDVDTALSLMEDTDLVRHDDDQAASFVFDQSAVLVMARTFMLPPRVVCTEISQYTCGPHVAVFASAPATRIIALCVQMR